jgi:glycosyltransferase involved in cell wall biosynthesis
MDGCLVPFRSAVHLLWCHDLAQKRHRPLLGSALWNLDAILVLSAYQRAQYERIHPGIPATTFVQSRNGLDLPELTAARTNPRDRWALCYGSRPERGLENALDVMALLAARGLPYHLHVSHYDNTTDQLRAYYEHLWARCEGMPNVTMHGALKRADWYARLGSARALLYPGVPGPFREISCLAAMEAQALGTPVVGCAKGALPETVHPDAGILIGDDTTDVTSPAYRQALVDAFATLAEEDARWDALSAAGRAHGATLGWDGVAAQWDALIRERMATRGNDPWRVRRHLEREGDREAAALVAA